MGLIEWIKTSFPQYPICLITGPADEAVEPLARWAEKYHSILRIHDISLPVLSALLSLGRIYIGNDSGVSHLAAASGVPTISIFGPTDPSVWSPWNPNVKALKRTWREEDVLTIPDHSLIRHYFPDTDIRSVVTSLLVGLSNKQGPYIRAP
jgi:ADP-heptose:LPS heptosyltransferase